MQFFNSPVTITVSARLIIFCICSENWEPPLCHRLNKSSLEFALVLARLYSNSTDCTTVHTISSQLHFKDRGLCICFILQEGSVYCQGTQCNSARIVVKYTFYNNSQPNFQISSHEHFSMQTTTSKNRVAQIRRKSTIELYMNIISSIYE